MLGEKPCNGLWVRRSNAKALPYFWLTVKINQITVTHVTIFRYIRRSFGRYRGAAVRFNSDALRARARYYVCKECGRYRLAGSIGDRHGCREAQEKRSKVAKQRKFTSEVKSEGFDRAGLYGTSPATKQQRTADKKD